MAASWIFWLMLGDDSSNPWNSEASNAITVGVQFTTSTSVSVTGVRFYKASTNTGTHIGDLWTASGQLLAQATFTNETASGWQQVNFSTPVAISPRYGGGLCTSLRSKKSAVAL